MSNASTNKHDKFFEYMKPTEEEFKEFWENCLFTIDTNVLKKINSKNEDEKKNFSNLKNSLLEKRVFLTQQVCHEMLQMLINNQSLGGQINNLGESIKTLNNLKKIQFKENSELNDICDICENLEKFRQEKLKELQSSIESDNQKFLKGIEEFDISFCNTKELLDIYKEGEERYKYKIPPGYEDSPKKSARMYGDLIIWYQIIKYSKKVKKDVIFVTDDMKKDWWHPISNELMIPLPVLRREFFDKTGQKIYFYTSKVFFEKLTQYLEEITKETQESDDVPFVFSVPDPDDTPFVSVEDAMKYQNGYEEYLKLKNGYEEYLKLFEFWRKFKG